MANAQDLQSIDIPAQDLAAAITQLGEQTGLQVAISGDLAVGKTSTAVKGPLVPTQALRQLLVGTGLSVRTVGDDGSVVTRNFVLQNTTEEPFVLGTIVLQGELIDRALEDSPTSAVVVVGETFEETGGDIDLTDLLERTPGVGAPADGNLTIRGIRSRPVGGFGGQTINTQIDGVSLPNFSTVTNGPYSTWDVEQVEILRGPQSTQQGRNALAGSVILRSKDPTFEPEFKLRSEIGSFGFARGSLAANTPLIDGTLAFRFSADVLESDGFVDNVTLGTDSNPTRQETSRAKLLWTPTEQFEAVASLTYNETESGGEGVWVDEANFPDRRVNFSNRQSREGAEQWIYGLRMTYEFDNGMTLNSETTYLDSQVFRFADFDGTDRDVPFTESNQAFLRDGGFDTTVFEQDLSVSFSTSRLEGTVGLFYTEIGEFADEGGDTFDLTGLLPPIPGVSTVNTASGITDNEITNIALYGEVDIFVDELLPGLSFTIGARYDYEEFENRTVVVWDPGFPQAIIDADPRLANSETRTSGSFAAFLPKLGVNYEIDTNQRISLTYQQGYRAGGAVFNVLDRQIDYDPEFTDNIELAYRGSFRDDQLRLRGNLFYTYWRDQQVAVESAGAGRVRIENAGASELYGLEFSMDADLTERFFVGGSVALVETQFLDFQQANGSNLAGNEFPDAPPVTARVTGRYAFSDDISLSLSGRYSASTFSDAQNSADQKNDSFFVVDTQLTYRNDDGWLSGFYVNNIFDEEYSLVRSGSGGGLGTVGTRSLEIGEPRTVGLFLQKTF